MGTHGLSLPLLLEMKRSQDHDPPVSRLCVSRGEKGSYQGVMNARLEQFISEETLAHPERTLHVLLETWPLDRLDGTQVRSYDTRSYLQMLSQFFASSLLKDPCQTYYPNVCVHGIDARQTSTAFQGIMDTARDADHLTKEQIDHCIKRLEVYREDKNVEGLSLHRLIARSLTIADYHYIANR